jgi:hypothetical protein
MDEKKIRKLEQRIARLEKAVLAGRGHQAQKQPVKGFTGATGGVRFLLSKGFFKKKHGLKDVRTALAKNGYHYSRQAAHVALNNLTAKGGPLVSLQEGGRKVYVERK